jgi:hypothetical protein
MNLPDVQGWRSFERPVHESEDRATVGSGAAIGPLAGAGKVCKLGETATGWRVRTRPITWISRAPRSRDRRARLIFALR